jgi:hypothetical protein
MENKKVNIKGKQVEVQEFTVESIEKFFSENENPIHIVADVIIGGISGTRKMLTLCTSFTEAEISTLGVNAYSRLSTAMKEVNADFFAVYRKDLSELAKLMAVTPETKKTEEHPGSSSTQEPSNG